MLTPRGFFPCQTMRAKPLNAVSTPDARSLIPTRAHYHSVERDAYNGIHRH